jgi:hypothetical protein
MCVETKHVPLCSFCRGSGSKHGNGCKACLGCVVRYYTSDLFMLVSVVGLDPHCTLISFVHTQEDMLLRCHAYERLVESISHI